VSDPFIRVRGARQHNLKNLNLDLPKDKLIVITGPSGSGKSSLAFETLYAEGQRRYVESLSAYARQFLNQQSKPDVDSIDGLSPAISIEQKTTSKNPRSTVGTVTEIHDYLRLLFARAGVPKCPECERPIEGQSVEAIVDQVVAEPPGERLLVLAPVVQDRKGEHRDLLEGLRAEGFVRLRLNGDVLSLDDFPALDKNFKSTIEVVIDRLVLRAGEEEKQRSRLSEAIELALKVGQGLVRVENTQGEGCQYSEHSACPEHGISFPALEPRLFSFNNPAGACPSCDGLGEESQFVEDLIVSDPKLTIYQDCLRPSGWGAKHGIWGKTALEALAAHDDVELRQPWKDLPEKFRQRVLYGAGRYRIQYTMRRRNRLVQFKKRFEGVIPNCQRRLLETSSETIRAEMRNYQRRSPCEACGGSRLRLEARHVFVGELNLPMINAMSIRQALHTFDELKLSGHQAQIAGRILKEVRSRLRFLDSVGLNYLSLLRSAGTLSGGEAQRIRLATQIGSALTGVLYVLDEPSIGLHQRDNERLLESLKRLRDLGNTVIVVEHDEETMRAADTVLDLGPGAGVNGGHLVAFGTAEELCESPNSLTGAFLSGRASIDQPSRERPGNGHHLLLRGARGNNLKNIDVAFPLGSFIAVTGVSGSGKSTLVRQTLERALRQHLGLEGDKKIAAPYDAVDGLKNLDKLVPISQAPIGRTPRSNPATYTGLFGDIRDLFAALPEAKIRGYKPGRFSFNVKGGRCETCRGGGMIRIEMHFLPDIFVTCETCEGKRYNRETLDVLYRGQSIADLLDLSILEARKLLAPFAKICRKLDTLLDVGLGYVALGQAATTLSGGEAQRIKLAKELSKRSTGKTLYILDEPTTGLHFDDIRKLLLVLHRLVEAGNTVLVIEHNLDVIISADHVIDLGPEGGDGGGLVIATGTPKEISQNKKSCTGNWLVGRV
jgi:excinuclease ABC subunit A